MARDSLGNFLAACSVSVDYALDAATTEALVIRRGLDLANEVGFSRIIIQPDCLVAVETLQTGGFSSMTAAPYYVDICFQATSFSRVEYCYCNRDANIAAHTLAREAVPQPRVWVDEPPSFIISSLINDVSVI